MNPETGQAYVAPVNHNSTKMKVSLETDAETYNRLFAIPIVFFGRVVDSEGTGIPGATVEFSTVQTLDAAIRSMRPK